MKRLSIYTLLMAGIMATSCSKQEVQEQKGIPMAFYAEDNATKTRTLLDTGIIEQDGNQLTVYDLYTVNGESVLYMDNTQVTYSATNGAWEYSPLKYWTEAGTHSFTAYLSKCGNITLGETNNYPTVTYDKDSETLKIADSTSPWEITTENQFDFLYAYHSRGMNEANPHRPVEFNLNHLLCAVQFNVVNLMPKETVTFNGFSLQGVYHTGYATITKDQAPVIYLTNNIDNDYFVNSESKQLDFNVPLNVFANTGKVGEDGYILLLPHEESKFGNIKAVISYQYGNTVINDREINLFGAATNNWRAGQKYVYNFYVQDNRISFEVKVVPWKVDDVIIEE